MNTAATPAAEPTAKPKTFSELLRDAMKGRRRPLRGRPLVDVAIKAGFDWAPTGTGLTPGTLFKSARGQSVPLPAPCRKCSAQFDDGKARCSYCGNTWSDDRVRAMDYPVSPVRHLVLRTGSLVKVEVDDEGHVYKPAPKLTKKERNKLKREARAAALRATA
jgi:hypothetical protein